MDKAVKDGQKGIAITDHGNMFGVFEFVTEAKNGILNLSWVVNFILYKIATKDNFKPQRENAIIVFTNSYWRRTRMGIKTCPNFVRWVSSKECIAGILESIRNCCCNITRASLLPPVALAQKFPNHSIRQY
jgi:DNA polymerase-3 subunit alpha